MLVQTLQNLIHEGLTSAKEIGELTGVAPSTVYRWINGQSEPSFNAVRMLIRHLPNREAQARILSAIITGTGWQFAASDNELDVNDDGRVDTDDALDSCIRSVHIAGEALTQVRGACKDGVISQQEATTVIALLRGVVRECNVTQAILAQITEARRRAKDVT